VLVAAKKCAASHAWLNVAAAAEPPFQQLLGPAAEVSWIWTVTAETGATVGEFVPQIECCVEVGVHRLCEAFQTVPL
jgi:hypothetical protein